MSGGKGKFSIHRLALKCAAIVAMLVCSSLQPSFGAAVAFQINPAHDGNINFKKAFNLPLKRHWTRDLGGAVSYPLIAGHMVYVTVAGTYPNGTILFGLSLKTGETVWQQQIGGTYNWSNAAYDRGAVFVKNFDGNLQAFGASDGHPIWSITVPSQGVSAPTAVGGQVFIGANNDGPVLSIDETTGVVQWSTSVASSDASSPAIKDGRLYLTYDCDDYAFDASTGAQLWSVDNGCEGGGGTTPVVYGSKLYVRAAFGDLTLDAATGGLVGTFASDMPPVFFHGADGRQYQVDVYDGRLYCVDSKGGQVVWSFAGDGQFASAPIVVNGFVFQGSQTGKLYGLDSATGKKLWATNVGAPIVGSDGDLVAQPWTGLGASEGVLVVPATHLLVAFVPKRQTD